MWEPCFVPRFFVRDMRISWSRRVHETLFGDPAGIAELLRERVSRVEALDAAIVHLGEVPALREERSKRTRNTKLLEAALAEDPADGDLAGFLAMELARAGDTRRAREIGERHLAPFLEAIAALPEDAPRPSPVQLASVLATCLVQDGDFARALAVARSALVYCIEPHPNLLFLEGAALERLGHVVEAAHAYEQCLAMGGKRVTIPVNPGATDFAPRLRLANLALASGEARRALEHLDRAGKVPPAFETAAALLRAEALLAQHDPARALAALEPMLARANPLPDLFALAGCAAEALGASDPTFHATARKATPEAWLEPRRRVLLDAAK
jgi:tetratricopeptide (TPR) repeat protein